MKLYCTPAGTWAGTEKDYKAALKEEGVDYKSVTRKQIEVPTSKPEMLEFLTFHRVNPIGGHPSSLAELREAASVPPQSAPTTIPDVKPFDLATAFQAAPITVRVELAVALLDELEKRVR